METTQQTLETTKQPVEAAGLLASLAQMFFKGIGNALDKAAQYEEEMGVLKQTNNILIYDKDENQYTLTIKLAPVKNKDSYYYVEATTNAPDLDVSSIDQKTMTINKSNINQFKRTIEALLENTGYSADLPEDAPEEEPGQVIGEPVDKNDKPESSVKVDENEIQNLLDDAMDEFENAPQLATTSSNQTVRIIVELEMVDDNKCVLTLTGVAVYDPNEEVMIASKTYDIEPIDSKGNLKDFDDFIGEILLAIQDYAKSKKLTNIERGRVHSSTTIQASFIREKGSKDINLTAIKASCDIRSAMEVIYDLAEDDDFINSLDEDTEQAFAIVDNGEAYDIEPIEGIDINSTYIDLFKAVSCIHSCSVCYQWTLGDDEWYRDSFLYGSADLLHSLEATCARWVISHTDKYPVPQCCYEILPTLDEFKVDGVLSKELIKEEMIKECEGLIDTVDAFYVNLEHSEQSKIDEFIEAMKTALTYTNVV